MVKLVPFQLNLTSSRFSSVMFTCMFINLLEDLVLLSGVGDSKVIFGVIFSVNVNQSSNLFCSTVKLIS